MRKVVISVVLVMLLAVPVLAAGELAGGYYFVADTALGNGLRFYVPADFASGSLTYDSSGYLFNLTSSSIYLYCPDYPDYTIYAPRFSGFQYRPASGSGYTYVDLNVHDISDTNVELLQEDPALLPDTKVLLIMVFVAAAVIAVALIFGPRR